MRSTTAPALGLAAVGGALALLTGGGACGPIGPRPASPVPINDCAVDPCVRYQNSDPLVSYGCVDGVGACLSSERFAYVVLVSIPSSTTSANFTVAVASDDLDKLTLSPADPSCGKVRCFSLPQPLQQRGSYQVTPELLREVHAALGAPVTTTAAIPAGAVFRPLWPTTRGVADTAIPAMAQGIPLLPLFSSKDDGEGRVFAWSNGAQVAGWRVGLMPGIYERTLTPDPPYDTAFPPEVSTVQVTQPTLYDRSVLRVDYPDDAVSARVRTTIVSRNGADPSLEGWAIYLRDAGSLAPLSQRTVLHGTGGEVTLNTLGLKPLDTAKRNVELVVEPPASVIGVPAFVDNVLADVVQSTTRYPAVPPPVRVTGRVALADGTPVSADLVFQDERDDSGSGRLITAPSDASSAPFIHYQHRQTTDPSGAYDALLPPGVYSVAVIPNDSQSTAAAATLSLQVGGPPQPVVQQGKNLTVAQQLQASGACELTDGRPLAGADVVAEPSIDHPGAALPLLRVGRTRTDAAGLYVMPLDPGTYDISVRPRPSTGFPWKVTTSHRVAVGSTALPTLRVPPPAFSEVRLLDSIGYPVTGAIVRGFALPNRSGAMGAVAVPIGEWVTDSSGVVRLLVAHPE